MMYTEEEIKKMQEQFDRENENELKYLLKLERENTISNNVKSMYQNGIDIVLISKVVNMSTEEVEKILKG